MPPRTAVFAIALSAALQAGAQPAGGGSRVEDEASRPMRMILEAARIKSRAKAAEAPPARPLAVAPRAPAPPAPAVLPQSAVATLEAVATPRAAIPDPAPAPVPQAGSPPAAAPAAPPSAPLQPLQLLSLVEPVTPRALLGKLRGEIRVDVAFTVAADGAVTDATVRSSSHPQMNAAVLEAVGQWRYQPIGSPREHAVQVVLRPGS